jgi:3-hydroxyisobutyrate dehydrogenase-like beta-hydroxyacid dehydrogenase
VSTIGVVHPGELGSALGRHLTRDGHRVVVTLEGRSERTRTLCQEAGLTVLPSLRQVIAEADVVLAAVPPASALATARRCVEEYTALAGRRKPQVYVDLCSISPGTAQEIAAALEPAGIQFVDAAVHGLAARLESGASLFLSGAGAPAVASLMGRGLRTLVVGPLPGQASALKMFLSGMSKGMCALFLEMAVGARRYGCLPEMLAACEHHYPEIMAVIRRLLPTYPLHARRRVEEMHELAATVRALGGEPRMAAAARDVIAELSRSAVLRSPQGSWGVEEIIEAARCSPRQENDR